MKQKMVVLAGLFLLLAAAAVLWGLGLAPPSAATAPPAGPAAPPEARAALCQIDPGTEPFSQAGYCFVRGLVVSSTGLVESREDECFTTVYKNSLAAMAFTHQGDISLTEEILDFFQDQVTATTYISGFTQFWDACTGRPVGGPNYWEGDNAFLLLALNHYAQETGGYAGYPTLTAALTQSLARRAAACDQIVAEGVANMYAALAPQGSHWSNWRALAQLSDCYGSSGW